MIALLDEPQAGEQPSADCRNVGVTLIELAPGGCRWPTATDEWDEQLFCGEPAQAHRSYCCKHHGVAYQKARRWKAPEPT